MKHPVTGKKLGTKIETTGWVKVILVQEDTACAVIEQSCLDIHAGDYLKPFEKVNVPDGGAARAGRVLPAGQRQDRPARRRHPGRRDASPAPASSSPSTPATEDGVAPGQRLLGLPHPSTPRVPTPRDAVGEATVVAVRERTATAKVTYSRKEVLLGDQVELR